MAMPLRRESQPLNPAHPLPPASPRLQGESTAVDAYDWPPAFTEAGGPSARFSPELAFLHEVNFWSADPREPEGLVFVRQSEGRVSSHLPLVSVGFEQCSMFLFRNDEGEALMFHHDSTVRSEWGDSYAERGGVPTSPSTPRRGLMGRRSPLAAFLSRGDRITMVLVESERASDRRELFDTFRSRGVEVLPPLLLRTRHHGEETDEAQWNVAYKPGSDELMVHVKDGGETRVIHWRGVLSLREDGTTPVPLLRVVPPEDGDIVDRLPHYRALLSDPHAPIPASAREVLLGCVQAVEMRNESPEDAGDRLMKLFINPSVPQFVREHLGKADLNEQGSLAMKGLTYLAESTLAACTGTPLVAFDSDSDWDLESEPLSGSDHDEPSPSTDSSA